MGIIGSLLGEVLGAAGKSGNTSLVNSKVDRALKNDWVVNNLFRIKTIGLKHPSSEISTTPAVFANSTKYNSPDFLNRINISITNVDLSTLEATPMEVWTGNQWLYTNGRPVMNQLTLTFVDYNNNLLYKEFTGIQKLLSNEYPHNQEWEIEIYQLKPIYYDATDSKAVTEIKQYDKSFFMKSSTAMLDNVSELRFDQSQHNQFMTFTVTFKFFLRA